MASEGVYAQTKPKTLKELVAEEKARKEAEKKAKEKNPTPPLPSREGEKGDGLPVTGDGSPESAADYVTDTDSAIWAPTRVKQLGAQNYGELMQPVSSLDLQDPNNISTTVEYQPESGTYIIRTKMGDTDITTPYMLTLEE